MFTSAQTVIMDCKWFFYVITATITAATEIGTHQFLKLVVSKFEHFPKSKTWAY